MFVAINVSLLITISYPAMILDFVRPEGIRGRASRNPAHSIIPTNEARKYLQAQCPLQMRESVDRWIAHIADQHGNMPAVIALAYLGNCVVN